MPFLSLSGALTRPEARRVLLVAIVCWSTSGMFSKLLGLPGATLAIYRTAFAGLCLLALVRGRRRTFRPAMAGMVLCFATMTLTFLSAMVATTAANTIFLEYTAPVWMFLAGVLWLGETVDRRNLVSLAGSMVGVLVIVLGGGSGEAWGIGLALASGVAYGGVAVYLRYLRDEDSVWLTLVNHFGTLLLLLPLVLLVPELRAGLVTPTPGQLAGLFAFGALQMALPYVLFSRALSSLPAQEAGILTLLEPVLNTLFAFLFAGERPAAATLAGGGIILAAIGWRYVRRG